MSGRDLNFVIIIGRLTQNPEIKYTTNGIPVAKFSIANNTYYLQNQERKSYVNYFDITVWGNQAINCEKYLKKGSQIAIEGHLRQNRWTDPNTNKTISKVEITATSVQFLTPASSSTSIENPSQFKNEIVSKQYQNNQKNNIINPFDDISDTNSEEIINYNDDFSEENFENDDDIPF